MSRSKLPLTAAGFTITELLVVISVFGVISVAFLGIVSSYFVVIDRNNKLTEMTINSQNLLRSTVSNIRLGDGVRQTNQLSGPGTAVGSWTTDDDDFVIVIPVPAINSARDYIINPATGSPYMNELVYYKNGTTLMRRTLAHPNATGNSLRTTCPAAQVGPTCAADTELAKYVNAMTFTLYDQDAELITDPALARSVKITLSMQRNAPGTNPLNLTTNMQVTLRNRF